MEDLKEQTKIDKREYAISHYRKWQQSGLSKNEYCRLHNLKSTTFAGWKRYFRDENNQFVKIPSERVRKLTDSETTIELKINKSLSISINRYFDHELLKRLLSTLGVLHDN